MSEKRNAFLRLLTKKGFEEENMTQVGLYTIGTATTLESNKSLLRIGLLKELNSRGQCVLSSPT